MISWDFSREICRFSLAIAIFGFLCIIPCRSQRKCEPLSVSLCQGLSIYNSTMFPNILGHGTQGEAAMEVSQYVPLVQAECSKDLVLFLCAVYAPVCNVLNVPAPPCRSICIRARDDCRGLMQEFGFSWPSELSCDKFPRLGSKICVSRALTPTPKSAPEGLLVFANRVDISRVPFGSTAHQTVIPRQIAATGIDYDFDTGFIYWTDTYLGYMQRAPLNNSRNTQIVMRGLSKPEGLAVDWVNKKLYWTDTGTHLIGVADFDGRNRMVLVNNGLKKPRGIAVHPITGYMFWTDWGRPAKIEKCGMDGNQSTRQVLIDRDIVWPNGLTLDDSTDRMWWTDARLGTIESSDLRGLDRKITARSWQIRGTFGISVFQNFVYVTKFRNGRRILKIDKTTGKSLTRASNLYSPRGIVVYHRLRQPVPQGGNPCQPTAESKSCSHICLLAPRHLYPEGYSCHCPAGFVLLEDRKTCNTTDSFKCKEGTCRNGGTCIERNDKLPVCRRCVMGEWKCDGHSDCPDNLGEAAGCFKCASNEFKCESILNPKCISWSWKCDGEGDCGDGSDEFNCTLPQCNTEQFMCNTSRKCIPDKWKCDGDMDCPDYSDESGCDSVSTCGSSQFQCEDGTCVEQSWRCDGDNDCFDNSDESGCSTANVSLCKSSEFQCAVGTCIPDNWRCDSQFDCSDKSDELNCSPSSCAGYEFQCGTGECIQRHRKCDGVANCRDQSDEVDCYDRWCGSNKYFCSNGRCIDLDKRCDGIKDCFNGSDEQECDIEKCEIHGGCSHFCSVDEDVYNCYCNAGYSLNQDNKTCKAEGSDEILFFSNVYDIRRITFQPHSYELAVLGPKGATGLDFDFEQNTVFWTDIVTKSIEKMRLKNATEVDVIVKDGLHEPEGIAVDWINRKLYWTDSGAHKIEVSDLDGKKRLPLVTSRLENPRAIAVHPFVGYMFWTDWGSADGDENPSKIEKCGMNGKNTTRQIIVKRNLGWPNGLAIDYTLNRIWWTDAKLDTIGSADLNGHHRRTVLKDIRSVKHPFGISIFQEDMYWTDWSNGKVFRANRFTGRNAVTVAEKLVRVMDVAVFHRQRQPEGRNPCNRTVQSGGCSHICLLAPVEFFPDGFSCHCPPGVKLLSDQKSCASS